MLHSPYWRYIEQPKPNSIVRNHGACKPFQGRLRIIQPDALSAAPTRLDHRRVLPTVHPPHGPLGDLPLVVAHCDAIPAFAASEICLINVTPILCDLTLRGGPRVGPPGPFSSTCRPASGQQRHRHRPRCRWLRPSHLALLCTLYLSAALIPRPPTSMRLDPSQARPPPTSGSTGGGFLGPLPSAPANLHQPALPTPLDRQCLADRDLDRGLT